MADASKGLHEPEPDLSETTVDLHRALVSVQEELEAVDWYRQRAECCTDPELRAVLKHNMREEIEHAAMLLEWLRRNEPSFETHLRTYLWTQAPITEAEEAATGAGTETEDPESADTLVPEPAEETLTLGSLKGVRDTIQ